MNDLSDLYDALDEAGESIGLAIEADPTDEAVPNWQEKLEAWTSLRTRVGSAMTEILEKA